MYWEVNSTGRKKVQASGSRQKTGSSQPVRIQTSTEHRPTEQQPDRGGIVESQRKEVLEVGGVFKGGESWVE